MRSSLLVSAAFGALLAVIPGVRAATDAGTALVAIGALLTTGDDAGAERLASNTLNAGGLAAGDRERLLIDRGLAHEQAGAKDDAIIDFTQAIDLHSLPATEQANALFDRGVTLDEMNRIDDAVGDYSAAIALMPRLARALNNRANAYRRLNRYPDAKRDYRASLAAGNPNPEYPYYGLGQIAEAEGDKTAARDDYAKAVAANPQYDLAATRLAELGGAPLPQPPPSAVGNTGQADSASGRIVLRQPEGIHLHPPGTQSTLTPANYGASSKGDRNAPSLRPAIGTEEKGLGPQIQLGAWRSQAEAEAGWKHATATAPGLLGGLTPHIVIADLPGKGRYYRLRVGPVARADAERLCAALADKGLGCVPAWN